MIDILIFFQIHMPTTFTKQAPLKPQCLADGVLGYSPERIAKTWRVKVSGILSI